MELRNSDTAREIREAYGLQLATDKPSPPIAVVDVNPKKLRRPNLYYAGSAANTTSSTLFTTPSDKDFYLTAASLSVVKDATATSTVSAIQVVPYGSSTGADIIRIASLTLTAQSEAVTQSWHLPLRLARGTNVTVRNGTATANVTALACVQGYTDDLKD